MNVSVAGFRQRFALATADQGGLLIDLTTGDYWKLNVSAAFLCAELIRTDDLDEAVECYARRFTLSPSAARSAAGVVLDSLGAPGIPSPRVGELTYVRSPDGGYDLLHDQRHIFRLAPGGESITRVAPQSELVFSLRDYLKSVAPKILSLFGHLILHGSAFSLGEEATGICGISGAGKTTTARAASKHGKLLAEDLLVVRSWESTPAIPVLAESRIISWCTNSARELSSVGFRSDCSPLRSVAEGDAIGLRAVWFLDARRRGTYLKREAMSELATLENLVAHAFFGSDESANWRSYLTQAGALSQKASGYEISAPDGLEELNRALTRYATNSVS